MTWSRVGKGSTATSADAADDGISFNGDVLGLQATRSRRYDYEFEISGEFTRVETRGELQVVAGSEFQLRSCDHYCRT